MLGAGTFINSIIRVITVVAILASISIFIVKPILESAENATNDAVRRSGEISNNVHSSIDAAHLNSARQRSLSYTSSLRSSQWDKAANFVVRCVKGAGQNPNRMESCANRAQELVHGAQPDRSFALSYATSLDGQGKTADADRVRRCVKEADLSGRKIQHCRELSDKLLFG